MNILVVHETEYIKKVVFEYQIIPELWASRGHKVFVVDFETAWHRKSFFDLVSHTKLIRNVRRSGKKKGVTLIRPAFVKIPVISRFTAGISHYFTFKKIIKRNKIDIMFLYSVPTNGLQALWAARSAKIPVYFRLLDVLHEIVPWSKILAGPTLFLERLVYKRVDELSAITPKLTNYALSLGANKGTTSYLPSGYDSDLFYPKSKNPELMKKYGLRQTDQIILFAGTLYNFSGLDIVLRYFAKHKKEFPRTKFLIVGHGQQTACLKSIIEENNLHKEVILTGFINYDILNDYLNLADICINPFAINKITNIIFPAKIYQYLACSKPVIATRLPGLIDIFPDNGGKNNVYYYSENRISEFFALLKKIKSRKFKDGELSLQQIAKIIEKRLKKLVEE